MRFSREQMQSTAGRTSEVELTLVAGVALQTHGRCAH